MVENETRHVAQAKKGVVIEKRTRSLTIIMPKYITKKSEDVPNKQTASSKSKHKGGMQHLISTEKHCVQPQLCFCQAQAEKMLMHFHLIKQAKKHMIDIKTVYIARVKDTSEFEVSIETNV